MDSILKQPIQYSCRRLYLGEILEELQERCGLKSVRPRAIAETRPLTVDFKSGSLRALLEHLAKELDLELEFDHTLACFWLPAPEGELAELESRYRKGDEQARCEAVYDLASFADPRIYRTLMAALRDPSPAVVTTAFTELYWNHASFLRSDADTRGGVEALLTLLNDPAWSHLHREILQQLRGLCEPAVLEALFRLVQSPDPEIVVEARFALAASQDPRAVDLFFDMLMKDDVDTRAFAMRTLAAFRDDRCVPAFLAAMHDKDGDVAEEAAWALGRTGDPRAFEPLVAALSDPRPRVRIGACNGLGLLGDQRAVPALAAVLKDGKNKREVRERAAIALGDLGGQAAIAALLPLRHHKTFEIRNSVESALADLGGAEVLAAYQADLNRGDPLLRSNALRVLCRWQYPPAIDCALADLRSQDVTLRDAAICWLSRSGVPSAIQALLERIDQDELIDKPLHSKVLWNLVNAREPSMIEVLYRRAGGTGGPPKKAPIESLNRLHDSSAEALALRYAAAEGENDKAGAALMLGNFRSMAASAALTNLLKSGDCFEFSHVAGALVHQRTPRAVPALIPVLKHTDESVRSMVVRELGRFRDPRLVPPIAALLKDPVADVRRSAVSALAEMGHSTAAELIASLKKDPDPKVRKEVREGLKKLQPRK